MATIILFHEDGVLHQVYTNLPDPITIRDFDPNDQSDPERAGTYEALNYAVAHGSLKTVLGGYEETVPRIWTHLRRPKDSEHLLAEVNRSSEPAHRLCQEKDAAFAAGYLEAIGDLHSFLQSLEPQVQRACAPVLKLADRQLERYEELCNFLNSAANYEEAGDPRD